MPKVNRFKNPLKLANGHASSSTTPVAQSLLDASIIPLQAHEVSHKKQAPILLQEEQASIPQQQEKVPLPLQQEQVPILPSNSSVPFMNHLIYSKYWNVDTINSENAIKKIWVNANEVNNLIVGERIIVNFDDNNTTYGQAQGLLVGYYGSLATDCSLFPICFERWSGPLGRPKKYIEDCLEKRLEVRESDAYRYCNASISKGWATHRQRLCNEYFDPTKSKNNILSNVPSVISKD
ncbi:hypothetical protein KY290_031161 [Solanum tuberosum]|uniref:Uncharacterized protein n=1 Tax=Solanum tuberosum TaxID=4113 RepID=A0ABQ7U9L5_SOLTU|nr:hypothetical protein KY290_031161 [Solanum tuberosum]